MAKRGCLPCWKHPELRKGELFIANICDPADEFDGIGIEGCEDWRNIAWRTKRLGRVAYDEDRNPLERTRPVFARASELRRRRFPK